MEHLQVQDLEYANATHKGLRSAVWIRGISIGDGYEKPPKTTPTPV